MSETAKKFFSYAVLAVASLIVVAFILVAVVDRQRFQTHFHASVALVESMRASRPDGVAAEKWDECINVTVTALSNVFTYDDGDGAMKAFHDEISDAKRSKAADPQALLCTVWRSMATRSSLSKTAYLRRRAEIVKQEIGLDCLPAS